MQRISLTPSPSPTMALTPSRDPLRGYPAVAPGVGVAARDVRSRMAPPVASSPPSPGSTGEGGWEGEGTHILAIDDISVRFGGVQALDKATLVIAPGRVTGVIGPNGSGKSTLFNVATGVTRANSGTVWFQGREITHLAPHQINQLGIGRTFQLTRLFGRMTAFENLIVVARGDQAAARERAEELLDVVSLREVRDEYGANLSYGQQKLLEFVRLMMTDPILVMLDEPFAGVNPTMERRLLAQMEDWLGDGMTIVVTDHEMKIMMEICQEIFVLNYGEVIAHGTPAEIRADPRVMEAYFGA